MAKANINQMRMLDVHMCVKNNGCMEDLMKKYDASKEEVEDHIRKIGNKDANGIIKSLNKATKKKHKAESKGEAVAEPVPEAAKRDIIEEKEDTEPLKENIIVMEGENEEVKVSRFDELAILDLSASELNEQINSWRSLCIECEKAYKAKTNERKAVSDELRDLKGKAKECLDEIAAISKRVLAIKEETKRLDESYKTLGKERDAINQDIRDCKDAISSYENELKKLSVPHVLVYKDGTIKGNVEVPEINDDVMVSVAAQVMLANKDLNLTIQQLMTIIRIKMANLDGVEIAFEDPMLEAVRITE